MAAAYAFGVARNHPFVDGKKRTAFVVSVTFLALNGAEPEIEAVDGLKAFVALAQGAISEEELASWFRERLEAAASED